MRLSFSPRRFTTQVAGLGALLLLTHGAVLGQCRLDKTNWVLDPTMSEDFDPGTTTASLSANWMFEYPQGPVFDETNYDTPETYNQAANLSFANGYAYFNTRYRKNPITYNGRDYNYTSAVMVSKHDDYPGSQPSWWTGSNSGALYGMYEIRCKLPSTAGQSPAYWMSGHHQWPPEIDVFEYNAKDPTVFFSTIHWRNKDVTPSEHEACGGRYFYPYNLYDDFHTWTMVWTPTKVTWFFDGKELRSDDKPQHIPGSGYEQRQAGAPQPYWNIMQEQRMDLILGCGLSWGTNSTQFSPFIVDYIHVYRPAGVGSGYTQNAQQSQDYYFNNVVTPAYASTPYKPQTGYWKFTSTDQTSNYHVLGNLQVCQGGGKFYYRGDYNLLWNTYYYDYGQGGQFYSAPLDWNETVDNDVAANASDNIVYYGHANQLKYYEGGSFHTAYNAASTAVISNVARGVKTSADGLTVYYVGLDGYLYHCRRTTSTSFYWTVTQVSSQSNIGSDYIIDPVTNSVAYYVTTAQQLVRVSTSAAPTLLPTSGDVSGALAISPAGTTVYYRTTSAGIALCSYANSTWTRSDVLARNTWTTNPSGVLTNVGAGLQVYDNPRQYHYIDNGPTPRVWNVYYLNGEWAAAPLDNTVNYAQNNLVLANQTGGPLCFVAADKKIRRFYWDNATCENLNPSCTADTYFRPSNPRTTALAAASTAAEKTAVKLYPNPAQDYVTVDASALQHVQQATVYSSQMQALRATPAEGGKVNLDVSSLPAGLYYVKVTTSTQSYFVKFVKQ